MSEWRSEPLADTHELALFDCGVTELNDWLTGQAQRAQKSDTARTYVWSPRESRRVVAYYAVAPTQVHRDDVSRGCSAGITRVPAYLLARLALDRSLEGQGLRGELLIDALEVLVAAATSAAGRLIVVDAINDEAVAFYRRYDFQPVKNDPRRLVLKVATARKLLLG